ncbi:MAG: sensor histidine kinase, partial [Flavobacteriales bacterium]|nr:sensor histidine kinase [Flavobacteriales bacterium]
LFKNSLFYLVNKPDGKIQIRLENGKDMNTLYFKDNGLGIPKDKLSSIFDNFMTYGKKEGTGLGLAFCKRVMIAFGGDVTCQSEYGQWTQFVLTFPKCHF